MSWPGAYHVVAFLGSLWFGVVDFCRPCIGSSLTASFADGITFHSSSWAQFAVARGAWRVVSVDFRSAEGLFSFQIDNPARRLDCPACGAAEPPIHDRSSRTWRPLNFFQYQAERQAQVLRVACAVCEKTSQVSVPWARPGSGFTQTLEAFIVALCEQMPVLAAARWGCRMLGSGP